jgi:L-galactose dehydrogenase/L-glyceraldehyde 3-phosphate reductase
VPRIELLQLHNGITTYQGEEPASIAPSDILESNGVVDTFRELQAEGLVRYLGLTATGDAGAIREVIRSEAFDTIQVPYNLLNPSAGSDTPQVGETDYGNILSDCFALGVGAFAIRVFAGGALLGHPPSSHTLRTVFFPLSLYQRDQKRAERWRELLPASTSPVEAALAFVLTHPAISSAIIGFGSPRHVEEIARCFPGSADRFSLDFEPDAKRTEPKQRPPG